MRLHRKAADNPAREVPVKDLPAEVAAELLDMLDQAQQQQGGPPLNPVLLDIVQKHALVSIAYSSGVTMHQGNLCQLQDAGTAFRLSPEEMWGIAGETLDGLTVRFPMIMVAPTDLDSADAATHFAALDELQNQNAQLHAACHSGCRAQEERGSDSSPSADAALPRGKREATPRGSSWRRPNPSLLNCRLHWRRRSLQPWASSRQRLAGSKLH